MQWSRESGVEQIQMQKACLALQRKTVESIVKWSTEACAMERTCTLSKKEWLNGEPETGWILWFDDDTQGFVCEKNEMFKLWRYTKAQATLERVTCQTRQ